MSNQQDREAAILSSLTTKNNKALAFQYEINKIENVVGVVYLNKNIGYHYICYN
jgi:hypothetical protein